MFNLFKQQKKYPDFDVLKDFDKKDLYFLRTAEWDWMDKNTVIVIDPFNPRVLTLGPWPQYIFIAANGQITITEYVYYMADIYSGDIPKLLLKRF